MRSVKALAAAGSSETREGFWCAAGGLPTESAEPERSARYQVFNLRKCFCVEFANRQNCREVSTAVHMSGAESIFWFFLRDVVQAVGQCFRTGNFERLLVKGYALTVSRTPRVLNEDPFRAVDHNLADLGSRT